MIAGRQLLRPFGVGHAVAVGFPRGVTATHSGLERRILPCHPREMKATTAILLAGAAALLANCMTTEESWRRVDGTPMATDQLQVDQTVRRVEAEKANMSEGHDRWPLESSG